MKTIWIRTTPIGVFKGVYTEEQKNEFNRINQDSPNRICWEKIELVDGVWITTEYGEHNGG